jgi:cobalt/nickel transport system permease protein
MNGALTAAAATRGPRKSSTAAVRGVGGALAAAGLAGDPASRVHRLDARAKLLGLAGLTLVAATSPPSAWPLLAFCAVLLAGVALAARVPARVIGRRALVVLPLVALAAASLPFLRHGGAEHQLGPLSVSDAGLAVFGTAIAKAGVGTLSAVLLAATTTVPAALEGLRRLHAPPLLVAIAGVMWRYVFVLAGEVARMRAALAARGHRPRHLLHGAATGRLAGALFLRAHARAERVHTAMAARGWHGVPAAPPAAALARADVAFVAALAGVPLLLRLALELTA